MTTQQTNFKSFPVLAAVPSVNHYVDGERLVITVSPAFKGHKFTRYDVVAAIKTWAASYG